VGAERVWGWKSPSLSRGKAPVGIWVTSQKLKLFVNICLNFDVLEEKFVKWQKIPSSKIRVG